MRDFDAGPLAVSRRRRQRATGGSRGEPGRRRSASLPPFSHLVEYWHERIAVRCQDIDRRALAHLPADDQSIVSKLVQSLTQHTVTDPGDRALKLLEASRPLGERVKYHPSPNSAQNIEDLDDVWTSLWGRSADGRPRHVTDSNRRGT